MGAAINETGSQVRTSFIPAGEGGGGAHDSGLGIPPCTPGRDGTARAATLDPPSLRTSTVPREKG